MNAPQRINQAPAEADPALFQPTADETQRAGTNPSAELGNVVQGPWEQPPADQASPAESGYKWLGRGPMTIEGTGVKYGPKRSSEKTQAGRDNIVQGPWEQPPTTDSPQATRPKAAYKWLGRGPMTIEGTGLMHFPKKPATHSEGTNHEPKHMGPKEDHHERKLSYEPKHMSPKEPGRFRRLGRAIMDRLQARPVREEGAKPYPLPLPEPYASRRQEPDTPVATPATSPAIRKRAADADWTALNNLPKVTPDSLVARHGDKQKRQAS